MRYYVGLVLPRLHGLLANGIALAGELFAIETRRQPPHEPFGRRIVGKLVSEK